MKHYPVLVYEASALASANLPEYAKVTNKDVTVYEFDVMTIVEAREFVNTAHEKPLERESRVLVLSAKRLSAEVQNTLLKTLEEPPDTTEIFLVVPYVQMLLPTVQSRVRLVANAIDQSQVPPEVENFLKAELNERMDQIAVWHKQKDTAGMQDLVRGFASYLAKTKPTHKVRKAFSLVESYMYKNGSAHKMLLEELALVIPVIEK